MRKSHTSTGSSTGANSRTASRCPSRTTSSGVKSSSWTSPTRSRPGSTRTTTNRPRATAASSDTTAVATHARRPCYWGAPHRNDPSREWRSYPWQTHRHQLTAAQWLSTVLQPWLPHDEVHHRLKQPRRMNAGQSGAALGPRAWLHGVPSSTLWRPW